MKCKKSSYANIIKTGSLFEPYFKITKTKPRISKPGFRANGFSLLPLALRPGLGLIRNSKFQKCSALGSLSLLSIVLVFSFLFQTSYVNNVSAASITLTIPSDPLSLDISDSSSNGGFHKSSASTFSVKTDALSGYTLSIKDKNSDSEAGKSNDLINSDNSSAKISSISSSISEEDFSSTGSPNTWGYLPSKLNSIDNTDFQPGPTSTPSTIDKTSVANADSANSYNFTLASKVDSSTISGTYSSTFILTAIANTTAYSITYNLDSGTWSGTSPQTGSTTEPSIILNSNTPTKEGHEFKGWCTVEPTSNNSDNPSCSGNIYQPSSIYNLIPDSPNHITLYAIWKQTIKILPQYSCPNQVTECSYGGVSGKRYGDSPCFQSSDAATYFARPNASSQCPSDWVLPSKSDFDNLVSSSQAGPGACLYEQGWNLNGWRLRGSVYSQGANGYYWSSTPFGSSNAYYFALGKSSAYVIGSGDSDSGHEHSVRCIHS